MKFIFKSFLYLLMFALLVLAGFSPWLVPKIVRESISDYISEKCHDCNFQTQNISFNLLKLQLAVSGFSVQKKNGSAITADFFLIDLSLKELLRRTILIEELELKGVSFKGLTGESVLSSLSRSEDKKPRRESSWKLKARKVSVTDFAAEDTAGDFKLLASGGEIYLTGDEGSGYDITARLNTINLKEDGTDLVKAGSFESKIRAFDGQINIEKVLLELSRTTLVGAAELSDTGISGSFTHVLDSKILGRNSPLKGVIAGSGSIKGETDSPVIEGTLHIPKGEDLEVYDGKDRVCRLEDLKADYTVKPTDKGTEITVPKLQAGGDGVSIKLIKPVHFTGSKIGGELELTLSDLEVSGTRINSLVLNASLRGNPAEPLLDLNGALQGASGDITANLTYNIKKSEIEKSEVRLSEYSAEPLKEGVKTVFLSGEISGSGPIKKQEFKADGFLKVALREPEKPDHILEVKLEMKDGRLFTDVLSKELPIKAEASVYFSNQPSKISFSITKLDLTNIISGADCGLLTAAGEYQFNYAGASHGTGRIEIKEAQAGCRPYTNRLKQPAFFEINAGRFNLKSAQIVSGRRNRTTEITLSGSGDPEQFSFKAAGEISLRALGPYLPDVQDLGGDIAIDLNLTKGPEGIHTFGPIKLSEGRFALEKPDLWLDQINLEAEINDQKVSIKSAEATANNGRLELAGSLDLADFGSSDLTINLTEAEFSPAPEASAILSAEIKVAGLTPPAVSGRISVERAQYEKQVSIEDLLTLILDLFEDEPEELQEPEQASAAIPLNIEIVADDEIFVITNWSEIELEAAIRVSGTTLKPEISGNLSTLYGWFQVGNNRVEIVSGRIFINPRTNIPRLVINGDTSILHPETGLTYINLNISGPINDPTVIFTSDTGLSQEEIIGLLTAGGGAGGGLQGIMDSVTKRIGAEEVGVLERLKKVVELDSLAVEPRYNIEAGAVQPTLIGKKLLLDDLTLTGERSFGSIVDEARALLEFDITERLKASGSFTLITNAENPSLGGRLSYAVIPEEPFLKIETYGLEDLSVKELLKQFRISSFSRLSRERIEDLNNRSLRTLESMGYPNGYFNADCVKFEGEFCRHIQLTVNEGKKAFITDWRILNHEIQEALNGGDLSDFHEDEVIATRENAEKITSKIREFLRKEGYFRLRLKTHYEDLPDGSRRFVLDGEPGPQFSLEFFGNEAFSKEEILEKTGFYTRRTPIGINFMPRLKRQILDLYKAHGFRKTAVEHKFERTDRLEFKVFINDGIKKDPKDLAAEKKRKAAGQKAEEEKIYYLELVGQPDGITPIDKPREPMTAAQANEYTERAKALLKREGFPNADAAVETSPANIITVRLIPGQMTTFGKVTITGTKKISQDVVRKAVSFKEGERYSIRKISTTRKSIAQLGLFRGIEIAPADGKVDGAVEDISIQLTERGLQTLTTGIGFESEYGINFLANGVDKSLFGDGKNLRMSADVSYDPQEAEVTRGGANLRYTDPFFLSTANQFTETLSYQQITRSVQEFDLERIALATGLQRNFENGFSYNFGHRFSSDKLSDVPPDAIVTDYDSGSVFLSSLIGSINYDQRDAPLRTKSGYLASLNYRFSSEALASDVNFLMLSPKISFVYPLPLASERWALASTAAIGTGWTFGDIDEIPIAERYYLGGRTTVRGFRQNSLGPRGVNGSIIGGSEMFMASNELRYYVVESTYLLTFLDMGNVWLRGQSSRELRLGTGLGVRYLSPVGPIGFDLAGPIDEKSGEPSIRFHFTIGSSF